MDIYRGRGVMSNEKGNICLRIYGSIFGILYITSALTMWIYMEMVWISEIGTLSFPHIILLLQSIWAIINFLVLMVANCTPYTGYLSLRSYLLTSLVLKTIIAIPLIFAALAFFRANNQDTYTYDAYYVLAFMVAIEYVIYLPAFLPFYFYFTPTKQFHNSFYYYSYHY